MSASDSTCRCRPSRSSTAGYHARCPLPQATLRRQLSVGCSCGFRQRRRPRHLRRVCPAQEGPEPEHRCCSTMAGNFTIAGTGVLSGDDRRDSRGDRHRRCERRWVDGCVRRQRLRLRQRSRPHLHEPEGTGSALAARSTWLGSNPDVAGAQVFVGTNNWQVRETGHRNHRSQDWGTLHFGLGSADPGRPGRDPVARRRYMGRAR